MISPLLTDLYQLTMAYGYWKQGLHEREAVFQLVFRKNPFHGAYTMACGLQTVIEFIQAWRMNDAELDYLKSLNTPMGKRLFCDEFLSYLKGLRLTCHMDAVPEGTLVFPQEPLLRVQGPLLQAQLLESTLLNIINFQTLIATKAARVCIAAEGDPVLEFGLRRAQGPDGGLSASRAAYIGGCVATSNVLAGQYYDIPVRGTHAHSWVTAFPDEEQAFRAYAEVMPDNCTLLVDTYDTLTGVKRAIEVGHSLRMKGYTLRGIRLDSGDLAALSIAARHLLDEAGFSETEIIASNALDEYVITELKAQGARISIWGVGTSLVTAYDQPALDGVYKLAALRDQHGQFEYKMKLSQSAVKISNPGIYQVRRFYHEKQPVLDMLYDVEQGLPEVPQVTLCEGGQAQALPLHDHAEDLLVPVFRAGNLVYSQPSIHEIRATAEQGLHYFLLSAVKHLYPVCLEAHAETRKRALIQLMSSSK